MTFEDMGFTPTQLKILEVLSDGERHHKDEIATAIYADENGEVTKTRPAKCLTMHIVKARKILRLIGHEIVCELYQRKIYYRHIKHLKKSGSPIISSSIEAQSSEGSVYQAIS